MNLDYNRRYSTEELRVLDDIDVYKLLLHNKYVRAFPSGFWEKGDSKSRFIKILKYLIEEELHWSKADTFAKLSYSVLVTHKLTVIRQLQLNDMLELIHLLYPDQIKPWQIGHLAKSYWNEDTIKEAVKWLIEEELQWDDTTIKKKLTTTIFKNKGLGQLVEPKKDILYLLLELTYPSRFKPWEFKHITKIFYDDKYVRDAVKWLVEDKLKITKLRQIYKITAEDFKTHGLQGLLINYSTDVIKLLTMTYPKLSIEQFKNLKQKELRRKCKDGVNIPLDYNRNYSSKELYSLSTINLYKLILHSNKDITFPSNFWNSPDIKSKSIIMFKYLIEKELKWSEEDIKNKLTVSILIKYRLVNLQHIFKNLPFSLLNIAYPNRFKPWEVNRRLRNYWNEETKIEAVRWLIEDKLHWSDKDIKDKLSIQVFKDNYLGCLLHQESCTPYYLINLAYPNKFKPWEFKFKTRNVLHDIDIAKTVKWLVEDKLNIQNLDDIYNIKSTDFSDNGLDNIIKYKDYITPLKEVYPELDVRKFKYVKHSSQHKIKEMNIF